MRKHAVKMARIIINSFTFKQYSLLEALVWLLLGKHLFTSHLAWWAQLLILAGVLMAAGIVTALIRMAAGLPREQPAKVKP
jgi:hypothetical protein